MNITTAKEITAAFKAKGWDISIEKDTDTQFHVFISNAKTIKWYDSIETYYVTVDFSESTKRFRAHVSAHRFNETFTMTQEHFVRVAKRADDYAQLISA